MKVLFGHISLAVIIEPKYVNLYYCWIAFPFNVSFTVGRLFLLTGSKFCFCNNDNIRHRIHFILLPVEDMTLFVFSNLTSSLWPIFIPPRIALIICFWLNFTLPPFFILCYICCNSCKTSNSCLILSFLANSALVYPFTALDDEFYNAYELSK